MADLVAYPTASANSYISQTDASKYFAGAIHADAWVNAEGDDKDKALITATRMIDREIWAGAKTSASQDLAFPRTGVYDRDGVALADDAIPQDILDATCEIALALLENTGAQTGGGAANVKSLTTSKTSVEFFQSKSRPGSLPEIAGTLVDHMRASKGVNVAGAAYGTDEDDYPSQFEDRTKWDRTEPLG